MLVVVVRRRLHCRRRRGSRSAQAVSNMRPQPTLHVARLENSAGTLQRVLLNYFVVCFFTFCFLYLKALQHYIHAVEGILTILPRSTDFS